MLREGPTEPMLQRNTALALSLPGAAHAAQVIQAQADMQDTMLTLADQLLVLFDEIPGAGLIRQHRRAIHQHVQTYFRIADGVWEALATDQLTDLNHSPGYTVATDSMEQKLIQIHEGCQQAQQNPKARGGWLWRRRVRLYSRGLLEWKRCLDTGGTLPDATTCGQALYRAHGRVGLAGISGFDYTLVMSLSVLGIVASLLLALLFGTMNVLALNGAARTLVPTALAGLSALYILWFSTTGPAPLPLVVGYALEHRRALLFTRALRASSANKSGPGPLRVILRVLLTTLGSLFVIGLVGLLVLTVLLARTFFANVHSGGAQDAGATMISLAQTTLGQPLPVDGYFLAATLPIICLLLIALFFLPFTLSVQARMSRALFAQPARSPEARRYALRPALELLSFHTITLFVVTILANSVYNFGADSVLPAGWPFVSGRALIYVGALALPYLFLVDLPYRQGIARWRSAKLRELGLRRNEIAQRLSRAQPQALAQTDLHTIQEYLTWQYYRTLESEAKDVPAAPFSVERRTLALILTILGGFLLSQINAALYSLLQIRL